VDKFSLVGSEINLHSSFWLLPLTAYQGKSLRCDAECRRFSLEKGPVVWA
jgi:hypothetical protein